MYIMFRYMPLKLPLSCEVVEKGGFWTPDLSGEGIPQIVDMRFQIALTSDHNGWVPFSELGGYVMSGLLFENNKHTVAKVRKNANRHGRKNATITKWRHWWQLLSENEKNRERKEMWLTGEKYWLATWSRLEKAKLLTDDLSQYDWRRWRLVTLVPEISGILPVNWCKVKRESQQWVKTLEHMWLWNYIMWLSQTDS